MSYVDAAEYPIRVELDHPLEVERWRPLVNWLLAVPHWAVLYVLSLVVNVVWVITFFCVLFTGGIPQGIWDFNVLYYRYLWRTSSFVLGLRGGYPPFDFQTTTPEPDVAIYEADRPERLSRLLPLVKWLLAFPHYIVLFLLYVAAFFAWFVGALAVLITGRWPEPIHHLLVGVNRWTHRVYAYAYFLTDRYPPFSLD
jgi:hypothetical protein